MSAKYLVEKMIINSYIETILWSSELDDFSMEDFDKDSLELCEKEVLEFVDKAMEFIDDSNNFETLDMVAHDFWLTRNGHGAGFWDKDYTNKDDLTALAKTYPERHASVEDGKIIVE